MKKKLEMKNVFVIIGALVVATSALAFTSSPSLVNALSGTEALAADQNRLVSKHNSPATQQAAIWTNLIAPVPVSSPSIPTNVLYEQLFRIVISIENKAKTQEATGQTQTILRDYFKNKANLNDEQARHLVDTAIGFIEAIEPIDAQAMEIIAQVRKAFPDGVVPEGSQVPEPPAALASLQTQRDAIALQFRDELQTKLGAAAFQQFDQFMQGDFASAFQPVEGQ